MLDAPFSPAVFLQGMGKWLGSFKVLDGIDFAVAPAEKAVICGP